MKIRGKTVSPLVVLMLAAIVIGTVSAVLINLWTSQTLVGVHEVTTDFKGIEAQLMQGGTWVMYGLKNDATSLVDIMHGPTNSVLFVEDAVLIVIDDYDVESGDDLILTIDVFEQVTNESYAGDWSCTPMLVEYYRLGGDGQIDIGTTLTTGKGPWTITYAQIEDMVYDPDYDAASSADDNALVLSFVLDGDSLVTNYIEDWVDGTDYTTHYDLKCTLQVDDGL